MKCNCCGSQLCFAILKLPKEELYICDRCGYGRPSIQTPIVYTDEYEKKYFLYPENEINQIRFSFIPPIERKSILDFGCGSGSFVRYARERGSEAYGYDINDFTKELRPPVDFIPNIVTAWDSFEHLTDEQQQIFFVAAKRAKLIIMSVPDFDTALKTGDVLNWRHYRPGEHLHYYTDAALCARFDAENFEPVMISKEEDEIRVAPYQKNILTIVFARKN